MEKEEELTRQQIAATIAHEIRNPLALIKATLQYLELSDENKVYKKNYDVIYGEIDRINGIVDEYLEKGGYSKLHKRKFALYDFVVDVMGIFEAEFSRAGIDVLANVPDFIEVTADYDKLKQVFVNVLRNSVEALSSKKKKEKGKIRISAGQTEDSIVIRISDNGDGISEEDSKFAGVPFFTTKNDGTGLGISICKSIVKAHGGDFYIKGEAESGAVVSISLPI